MPSGSIQNPPVTQLKHSAVGCLDLTVTAGTDLSAGQEVVISGNNTVSERGSGNTVRPVGVVVVPGLSGEEVVVRFYGNNTVTATAKGGALAANALVRQDGTLATNGTPNYLTAASTHVATGVVLRGGAEGSEIIIVQLFSPFVVA